MVKKLLILFIFLSFITKSIGGIESSNPILARITFSDIFGALALLFGLKYILIGLVTANKSMSNFKYALVLVICMFLVIPFSLNIQSTAIEAVIILFLVLISILIFYFFKEDLLNVLFPIIINTIIVASIFGFYDLIASMFSLPRIFSARNEGEVISGFRNAGQAGAYFLVFLTLLIPLKYSNLKDKLPFKYKKRLNIAIIISIIFLASTGKIAAYLGFVIGVFLFLIKQKNFKSLFVAILTTLFIYIGFINLGSIAPKLNDRLNYKIETRIIQNYEGTSKDNFFKENYGNALDAFYDNPFTGSGIGSFHGNYGKYEVHSTYFKMLGEGGVILTIVYLVFIISFIRMFTKKNTENNPYSNYLYLLMPFIIGCLISWGYTYHLRKREFWILFAVVSIVIYKANCWKLDSQRKLNSND